MVEHGAGVWSTSATQLAQARFLYTKYKDEYNAAFPDTPLDPRLGLPTTDPGNVYPATGNAAAAGAAPGAFEMMPIDAQNNIYQMRANLGRAFDTYPRKLTTPDSPFQRYVRDNDYAALSGAAKRGPQAVHRQGRLQRLPQRADPERQQVPQHRRAQRHAAARCRRRANALNRGRAAAVAANVASLNLLDANPDALDLQRRGQVQRRPDVGRAAPGEAPGRRTPSTASAAACPRSRTPPRARTRWSPPPRRWPCARWTQLECLKMDAADPSLCVCRKTDDIAVPNIDACTSSAISSELQTLLRADTTVACLKYDDTLEGMFRTPTLLNVAETAALLPQRAGEDAGRGPLVLQRGRRYLGVRRHEVAGASSARAERQRAAGSARVPEEPDAARRRRRWPPKRRRRRADPSTVWDWSKNTAKPPLTGLGGAGGATGAGGAGGTRRRGRRGRPTRAATGAPARPARRRGSGRRRDRPGRSGRRGGRGRASSSVIPGGQARLGDPPADRRRAAAARNGTKSGKAGASSRRFVNRLEGHRLSRTRRLCGGALVASGVALSLITLRSLTGERAQAEAAVRAARRRRRTRSAAATELRAIEAKVQAAAELRPLNAAIASQVDSATLLDLLDNEDWWRPYREEFARRARDRGRPGASPRAAARLPATRPRS